MLGGRALSFAENPLEKLASGIRDSACILCPPIIHSIRKLQLELSSHK